MADDVDFHHVRVVSGLADDVPFGFEVFIDGQQLKHALDVQITAGLYQVPRVSITFMAHVDAEAAGPVEEDEWHEHQ